MTKGLMSPRTVACTICSSTFITTHSVARYCSPECARVGARASWRRYGQNNADGRKAYRDKYYQENKERVIARITAYRQTDAGKRTSQIKDQRQREKFPEKYAARQAVLMALRKGELVRQPCQQCGASRAQAHHDDYSKPLKIEWLCRPCHDAEHRAQRIGSGTVGFVMEDGHVKGQTPPPAAEKAKKKVTA